jgi:predicted dinucleotide-binding enzyme
MSYAIIGFGNIGQALAKAFARKGIEVSVATTRDPESFASAAAAIGPTIIPKKLAEAVKADIVFFGCPFRVASGCREGAAHLAGEDDRRCDQCLRRAPRGTEGTTFFQGRRAGLHWR